jgi:deoxyhypusine synthase
MDKKETVKKNLFRKSEEAKGTAVRGYDFNEGVDWEEIMGAMATTGHQASEFARAVEITNKMISEKAFIFLGYTSSMVSSGLRESFRWLIEHKKVMLW